MTACAWWDFWCANVVTFTQHWGALFDASPLGDTTGFVGAIASASSAVGGWGNLATGLVAVVVGLFVLWLARDLIVPVVSGAFRRRSPAITAMVTAVVIGFFVGLATQSWFFAAVSGFVSQRLLSRSSARRAIADIRAHQRRQARPPGPSSTASSVAQRRRQPDAHSYDRRRTELVAVERSRLGTPRTWTVCAADRAAADAEVGSGWTFVSETRCGGNQLKAHYRYRPS